MQTARFEQLRKRQLEPIFNKMWMVEIWRNIVRAQLRSQDIKDLYDYYDFNFNIMERAQAIRAAILNGSYKASQPLVYRIEKKYGISRHMVLPQPIDALVLQILAENIIKDVIKHQPSQNAFYSRSKSVVPKPHEAVEYGQSLKELWIKLQKKIYNFSKKKKLIVTTDLSNYYDSINMEELKKVLTSYLSPGQEVIIDLLFGIIETISWHPDYLPYSGRGLPTSNLEAIRLMAHSFLFEVDQVLKENTKNCFTRWMDDIVIGVNSKKEAREAISAISDMLKSRGLALNLAKTNIYTAGEALFQFQIQENTFLDSIAIIDKSNSKYNKLSTSLKKRFKEHYRETRSAKSWDKVAKRYITLFSKLKSDKLLTEIVKLYITEPALRTNLLYYLQDLGYKQKTSDKVLGILDEIDVFDDISLYQICNLVVSWQITDTPASKKFLKQFEGKVAKLSFARKNPSDFYSLLWFKAKYTEPKKLVEFLIQYTNIWQSDAFLRRQATAIFSRLYMDNNKKVRRILQSQVSSGEPNTVSLANQLLLFIDSKTFNSLLSFYLFPEKIQDVYPMSKFLVLCSVLNSKAIRENKMIQAKVLEHIKDPFYRKWLGVSYNIR